MTASQKGMVVLIQKFGNIRNYVLMPFKGGHPQENKLNDKISLNTSDREFNQHRFSVHDFAIVENTSSAPRTRADVSLPTSLPQGFPHLYARSAVQPPGPQ